MAGIPVNFYDLDAMTQGLQRSDLIIVAGRPAIGKTSIVLNMGATRLQLCQPSEDFPLNDIADTIEEGVRLSHGRPYLVQWIGQNLVTHYNRQVFELGQDHERPISVDDWQAVVDSADFFQDGTPYFKGIWMQAADFPLGQQAILQAMAEESKDLQQLTGDPGLSEDAALEALHTLAAHDVVLRRAADQRYGFSVELMRRYPTYRWAAQGSIRQCLDFADHLGNDGDVIELVG